MIMTETHNAIHFAVFENRKKILQLHPDVQHTYKMFLVKGKIFPEFLNCWKLESIISSTWKFNNTANNYSINTLRKVLPTSYRSKYVQFSSVQFSLFDSIQTVT